MTMMVTIRNLQKNLKTIWNAPRVLMRSLWSSVSSDGAGKINLAVAVGNHLPEEMSIQIHDDLISVVAYASGDLVFAFVY